MASESIVEPWFSPAQGAGLRDFWEVYTTYYPQILQATLDVALADPQFGPIIRSLPPEVAQAQSEEGIEGLRLAIFDGRWGEYETKLRQEGAIYAKMGIAYSAWSRITRAYLRVLFPLMVKAFSAEQDRLAAALIVAQDFIDRAMTIIVEEYLETKQSLLRESEARKTAVMEAALDVIVLMDHNGTITDLNSATENTFRARREDLIGKPLAEVLMPPSLRAKQSSGPQRYLETGLEPIIGKRIEVSAIKADGTEFPAEVAVVRIRSQGSPLFTGYIRDITERKRAAEAESLRRAKDAAEAANAELEAFSYSVAHDLRTPLRAINGFSTALLEDYGPQLNSEAKGYLDRIVAGAVWMGQLIDALLSLAQLTRTALRREAVNLSELANATIAQLRVNEPNRSVEFMVAKDMIVQGDAQLLRSLIENLLGNTWKFTAKKSSARIDFGHEELDGVVVYYVRDNGVGFNMALVGKLFAPFRRLHTRSEFEGTGIGLVTVQRIVRRHGGRIWAEGAENQGATFRFTLPDSI